MSSRRLLPERNELFTQADSMAAGLRLLEIKKNQEARLLTDLETARQNEDTYHKALAENVVLKIRLRAARAALKEAKDARDYSETVLRWQMGELVNELSGLLKDDDPAWYSFGLNRPCDPETPAVPDRIEVIADHPGTFQIHWVPAARANRYKVYIKKDGDEDYKPVLATHDTYVTVNGVKSHSTVSVRVSSANRAGESALSEPVELVVPEEQFATSA